MLSKISTATLQGLEALHVNIEANVTNATIMRFIIVGMPDVAVKESQERVLSALDVNGYKLLLKQVVVNLAPADIRKEGSGFDLPIAIGVLVASEVLSQRSVDGCMFVGELGLDGHIQPVKGALSIAIKAREMGFDSLFVPYDNVREAAVVNRLKVFGVRHIKDVIAHLNGTVPLTPMNINTRAEFQQAQAVFDFDFDEVKGQDNVKRAFEIAAAGGHNVILIGSPGCGKSMMAKRLPSILPPLSLSESLETTKIHSIAGKLQSDTSLISKRPFRAPHHTVSDVALVGGGNTFMPGEICLAHNGVLFLDELPEFSRNVLETLRQPLEDRIITIRGRGTTLLCPAHSCLWRR